MGKKQRERKERKEQQKRPGAAPPGWASGEVSAEAREIMDALGRGELFRNERQLFEIVTNSAILRAEPEFDDYEFDVDEVARTTSPLLAAKEQDLERARSISQEEHNAVYDEVRMEAIDAILTRERRREFLRRYDEMLTRLLAGTDTDKIRTALVTRSVLDQKGTPWGLTGIVVELFEEAKDAIVNRLENVEELVIESLKKQHPEMTDDEMRAMLADPERMEAVIEEIDPSPEQSAELEEMTDRILDDFERTLYRGNVPIDLFTDDEMEEVARRLNAITAEINEGGAEPQTRDMVAVARMLQAYIGEVMTPERQATLATDLTGIIRQWQDAKNDQSLLLEMEHAFLDQVEPADNQFIYAALVGQLRRASGVTDEDEIENAEGEPDSSVIDGTVIDSL